MKGKDLGANEACTCHGINGLDFPSTIPVKTASGLALLHLFKLLPDHLPSSSVVILTLLQLSVFHWFPTTQRTNPN